MPEIEGADKEITRGNEEYDELEQRLMRLSEYYLSAKKLRYQDDITKTLVSLYCLKECEETEKADRKEDGPLSFFRHPMAAIGRLRKRGKCYRGIDGEYYRESDFVTWRQAHSLLLELRKRIKSGRFTPDWS